MEAALGLPTTAVCGGAFWEIVKISENTKPTAFVGKHICVDGWTAGRTGGQAHRTWVIAVVLLN